MNSESDKQYIVAVGRALKKARTEKGLTQAEVAVGAGFNANYYAMMERGEVNASIAKLGRVCAVLGIDPIGRR